MDAMTYTSVRANLASTMHRVCEDHEALIITRNGEKAVVMLSLEDYIYRKKQDRRVVQRINKLFCKAQRDPFSGIGKPEPLRHALSGFWSRRIDDEHRMVYCVTDDALEIAQLRFRY